MGEDAEKMNSEFQDYVPCTLTRSLNEAVTLADEQASSGDVVLLAPACASFDMFPNFMARGNQFIELVNAL